MNSPSPKNKRSIVVRVVGWEVRRSSSNHGRNTGMRLEIHGNYAARSMAKVQILLIAGGNARVRFVVA